MDARTASIRPWLFLLPALFTLVTFVIYPTVYTIYLSFHDARGVIPGANAQFNGLDNYQRLLQDRAFLQSFANNVVWVIVFIVLTVGIGLLLAVLSEQVRYANVVKSLVFFPMVISYVAGALIWLLVYNPQFGSLNALLSRLGLGRQIWMGEAAPMLGSIRIAGQEVLLLPVMLLAVIVAAVWMWTGFATVLISAGLKSIPVELVEAAKIDGANEWQIFGKVILPLLRPTLVVIVVTLIINALKIFDIVFMMVGTSGGPLSAGNVLANFMYAQMRVFDWGYASAVAVVLFLLIIPFMIINARRIARGGEL